MEKPKLLTSEILFDGYFHIRKDILERSDGQKSSYSHCVMPTDAAVVLAQTADGRFVLNREYRHPTGGYLLGLPGGSLNPGEDPLTGGRRELHEETGYWSDELSLLGCVYPLPALCSQKIYILRAKNAVPKGRQSLDPFEYIQPELKSEPELLEYVRSGHVHDGLLLSALSFWQLSR